MTKSKLTTKLPFSLASDAPARMKNTKLPLIVKDFYESIFKHKQFAQGLEMLEDTHRMSGLDNAGVIITGEPGVGKSTLINSYIKQTYAEECYQPTDTLTPLPVLAVRVPGRPTIPRTIEKILRSAEHLMPTAKRSDTLENRLHMLIQNQGVEMIIFDEFQHLLPKNVSRTVCNPTVNFIKTLADDYNLAFCFTGLPAMTEVLDGFKELSDRVAFGELNMTAFTIETEESTKDFRIFIRSIQNKIDSLGLHCLPLTTDTMLKRLLIMSDGKARHIAMFFAKVLMRRKPGDILLNEDLVNTFQRTAKVNRGSVFNPFLASNKVLTTHLAKQKLEKEHANDN